MDCLDEPDLVPAWLVRCGEQPYCDTVHCFRRVMCLVAKSTAIVLSGCRTSSDTEPYYCVCPYLNDPIRRMSGLSTTPQTTTPHPSNGLSGGAIAGIVIGCLLFVVLVIGGFILFRKIKESRRNHGEYRPQYEESHRAKDLPYLPPPNIEGLI